MLMHSTAAWSQQGPLSRFRPSWLTFSGKLATCEGQHQSCTNVRHHHVVWCWAAAGYCGSGMSPTATSEAS